MASRHLATVCVPSGGVIHPVSFHTETNNQSNGPNIKEEFVNDELQIQHVLKITWLQGPVYLFTLIEYLQYYR